MNLTDKQIETLKTSYAKLKPLLEDVAPQFYADLFRRDERVR